MPSQLYNEPQYPELGQENPSQRFKRGKSNKAGNLYYKNNKMYLNNKKKQSGEMSHSQAFSSCGIGLDGKVNDIFLTRGTRR